MKTYLVIYKNKQNKYIYRTLKYPPPYKIGDKTSMGWYVVEIQEFCEGRFYSKEEIRPLKEKIIKKINKEIERNKKENKKVKDKLKKKIIKYLE